MTSLDEAMAKRAEAIAKQWPGFEVKCLECGSTSVVLIDDRGWSEESGPWGDIKLQCDKCHNTTVIADNYTL